MQHQEFKTWREVTEHELMFDPAGVSARHLYGWQETDGIYYPTVRLFSYGLVAIDGTPPVPAIIDEKNWNGWKQPYIPLSEMAKLAIIHDFTYTVGADAVVLRYSYYDDDILDIFEIEGKRYVYFDNGWIWMSDGDGEFLLQDNTGNTPPKHVDTSHLVQYFDLGRKDNTEIDLLTFLSKSEECHQFNTPTYKLTRIC